jgi:uncharacterized membrane protein YraQ (UPF0718 family)
MSWLTDTLLKAADLTGTMAWETWWALVLGFTIAGAVESFVSERTMSRVLGGGGVKSVALGTLFGAASSSCSFGAVATTKSLFKKGASPAASLGAFQFASTNLVIELGLVMWVLLGWQFVAANVVAGLILIVVLAATFTWIVPKAWFEEARAHLKSEEGVRDPQCGMEVDPDDPDTVTLEEDDQTLYFCSESCRSAYASRDEELDWKSRLTTKKGWNNAFQNAFGEWKMLWKDIVGGFVIAGLIGAFVPREWWATFFSVGTEGTFWHVVLTSVIGVVVGVITFVCSVGNVPFGLILWRNGIPFGGVMAFIFADLIVPTITDAYRRYYGLKMAVTLFVSVFIAAVATGVAIHYLWLAFGLMPQQGMTGGTAPEGYTLYLNLAFTPLFLAQVWASKRGGSDEGDSAEAETGGSHDQHEGHAQAA